MQFKFAVLHFTTLCISVYGGNILAILPSPSYSHQIAYRDIWKELSLRGHQVTLITTDPLNDTKLKNLTEIDVSFSYGKIQSLMKELQATMNMWNGYSSLQRLVSSVIEDQLTNPNIKTLFDKSKNFDVLILEFIYPELLALAEIYECPTIFFSTADMSELYHQFVGNPSHPAINADLMAPFFGKFTFFDRLVNTIFRLHTYYMFKFHIFPEKDQLVKKYFNVTKPIEAMIKNVDLMFTNSNPIIQSVRAVGPATISVGGGRHIGSDEALPKDLAQFLDNAKEGFIYFSLGSNVKSKDLNEESLQAIMETLGDLPYKVLWKFENDSLPGKPDNVKLIKWAPQQQILSHPNIKLFITQGGLQSMEEAISSDVPFVVIPFFGDQEQNAKIMKTKGIAVVVQRIPSIDKKELKDAILEVLNNPSYRENVKRLRQLALDTPMTGLEKAIWWTEYVIRNKGAKHLRNPAVDLPTYQFYLLDVIGFLLGVSILIFTILFIVLRTLYRFLLRVLRKSQSKHRKSD